MYIDTKLDDGILVWVNFIHTLHALYPRIRSSLFILLIFVLKAFIQNIPNFALYMYENFPLYGTMTWEIFVENFSGSPKTMKIKHKK